MKRKLGIGVATLATAAFAGGAYAASQDSGANARQAFLNDVAKRLNVTPKQLSSALSGAAVDQLNAAVKAGKLTQAQANALKQRIQRHQGLPLFAPAPLFRPPIAGPFFGPLAGAASYLGLTDEQLFNQLTSGKSLAQIAQARGKSVAGLKQAMISAVKTKLDRAVAAKMLTSAQEQKILGNLTSIIDRKVSESGYGPRFRYFRKGPGFFGYGRAMRVRPPMPMPGVMPGPAAMGAPAPVPGVPY